MKKMPKPKSQGFKKPFLAFLILMITSFAGFSQGPTITGPENAPGIPATLSGGVTEGQVYFTEPEMSDYEWEVSSAGIITAGQETDQITVTWTNPTSQQSVRVTYTDASGESVNAVLFINYYPFLPAIDPTTIPQFVDPLPHFAAGLRVNAKAGGNLLIKAVPVQQVALSTGTVLNNGTIGVTPNAGLGNYAAYAISKDGGTTFGPAMWPAQTIETRQGFPLKVQYRNDLFGVKYSDFNILADQTLMMKGYELTGDPLTEPYNGDIPMVVHLHGGEMPSNSDGGPNAWFTPGYALLGPAFEYNASSLSTYPNMQEATTLWFHPHDDGLTRINVYTGLAGYYFIRGADEEAAHLPGWTGDSKVQEVTPAGKTATFNGTNTYLPEIELGIQDRMFNTNGELFWPVDPPNPELHPFWTPEFVGDVMVVNGKSWPYLSVAPRKYRFRILEGCNARFLNMWLVDANGNPGPVINVVGGEGGLLASPVRLDPALGQTLLMAPGQRYDVVIDFTGLPANATYTLMNDAGAPFPDGDPVIPGLTDRIMQFVVNGKIVNGKDKSVLPKNLRPVTPLVKLTDFSGNLTTGVTPAVKRQLVLNEVSTDGGPAAALINNAFFDVELALPDAPLKFGGPTEIPVEGTTEIFQIINISADAHPIHIHLTQWQLVSRQAIDVAGYSDAYAAAWSTRGLPEYPEGQGYPGGAGSPYPYTDLNDDDAVGGNPAISTFLVGPIMPAGPEEWGWKDNVIVNPGEVTTFITRLAPTDRPVNAAPAQLLYPFDPSEGPGYVWHCHIVDHEDMSMMRPLPIVPSPLRNMPTFTAEPGAFACQNTNVIYSTQAGMTNYVWTFSGTLNKDYMIVGGSVKTNTVTLQWLTTGIKTVSVNYTNLKGNTLPAPIESIPTTIETPPVKPGAIIASATTFTPGQTYLFSVPLVTGVTYNWAYSGSDATLLATANSVSVSLSSTATSGTLSVTASNSCGVSQAQTLSIILNSTTSQPVEFLTYSSNVCQTQSKVNYEVQHMPNTKYTWTYSGTGATIKGAGAGVKIDFRSATSGTLSVTAKYDGLAVSSPLTIDITVDPNCTLKSASMDEGELAVDDPSLNKADGMKVFPNPTSGAVTFEFQINDNARVSLDLYSATGMHINQLFDADVAAGETKTVLFDQPIPAGVYFYYLTWNGQTINGKFIKTN